MTIAKCFSLMAALLLGCGGQTERTVPTASATGVFVAEGDSLTHGVHGERVWAGQLSLPEAMELHNVAKSGETLRRMLNAADLEVDPLLKPGLPGIAALWAGTNDLWGRKEDPAILVEELLSWCRGRRLAGFVTVALTVIPRGDAADVYQQDFEARRVTYNALARARYAEACDVLVDLDGLPGAPGDGVIYAEFVHLTTAGQGFVAQQVERSLEGL